MKACVFDAFGTLFKVTVPLTELEELVPGRAEKLLNIWRSKILEYTWIRNSLKIYANFEVISREALRYAADSLMVEAGPLEKMLLSVYLTPSTFSDVAPTLKKLKLTRLPTAILSNGTLQMLEQGVASTGINSYIDHLISVDKIRRYKPLAPVYDLALEALNCEKKQVVFISGNAWDIAGAGHFGFQTVWLNRNDAVFDKLGIFPDYTIRSLEELPSIVRV